MTKEAKKHIRDPYSFTVSLSIMKNSNSSNHFEIMLNNTIKYYYVLYSLRPSAVVSQLRGSMY